MAADLKSVLNSTEVFDQQNGQNLSVLDFQCPICLQLLVEPVVMPCKHELCRECFRQNVEEANLVCPMCRKRISSWARKHSREGTLIDAERWELIQKLFPERCKKRLMGVDDDDNEDVPAPKRLLSSSGELRKEYEQEIKKIHEAEEAEKKASEELIKKIQEMERKAIEEMEKQRQNDQNFAQTLSQESLQPKLVMGRPQPKNQPIDNRITAKKKTNSKSTVPVKTLHNWFSPVRNLLSRSSTSSDSSSDLSSYEVDYESKGESSAETSPCSKTFFKDKQSSPFTLYEQEYFKHLEQKRLQEEHDMRIAKELQKKFDLEERGLVNRQKGTNNAYSLRRGTATETITSETETVKQKEN